MSKPALRVTRKNLLKHHEGEQKTEPILIWVTMDSAFANTFKLVFNDEMCKYVARKKFIIVLAWSLFS